jgi:hypothetical protein
MQCGELTFIPQDRIYTEHPKQYNTDTRNTNRCDRSTKTHSQDPSCLILRMPALSGNERRALSLI